MFLKAILALAVFLVCVTADGLEDEKSCQDQLSECSRQFEKMSYSMQSLEYYAGCVKKAHCGEWEDEEYRRPVLDYIRGSMESMQHEHASDSASHYTPMTSLVLFAPAIRVFLW